MSWPHSRNCSVIASGSAVATVASEDFAHWLCLIGLALETLVKIGQHVVFRNDVYVVFCSPDEVVELPLRSTTHVSNEGINWFTAVQIRPKETAQAAVLWVQWDHEHVQAGAGVCDGEIRGSG